MKIESKETFDDYRIFISDIKSGQVLATKFVGGRRELVEFSSED